MKTSSSFELRNFGDSFNPFVPNVPFLYPLKISEDFTDFCFQEVEERCIGNKWVHKQ